MHRDEIERLNDGWNAFVRQAGEIPDLDETVSRLHAMAEAIEPPPGFQRRVFERVSRSPKPGSRVTVSLAHSRRSLVDWLAVAAVIALVFGFAFNPWVPRNPEVTPAAGPSLGLVDPSSGCDVAPRTTKEVLALAEGPGPPPEPTRTLYTDDLFTWDPQLTDTDRQEVAAVLRQWFACGAAEGLLNRWALATDGFVRGVLLSYADQHTVTVPTALEELSQETAGEPTGLRCTEPDRWVWLPSGQMMLLLTFAGDATPATQVTVVPSNNGWHVAGWEAKAEASKWKNAPGQNLDVVEVVGPCALSFLNPVALAGPGATPTSDTATCSVPPRDRQDVINLAVNVRYIEAGANEAPPSPPTGPASGQSIFDAARDATATLQFWLGCSGPDDLLRRWSLATERYVATNLADYADRAGTGLPTALDTFPTVPGEPHGELRCVQADRTLPNGGITLIVQTVAPGDQFPLTDKISFRYEQGRWQIDEVVGIGDDQTGMPACDPSAPSAPPMAASPTRSEQAAQPCAAPARSREELLALATSSLASPGNAKDETAIVDSSGMLASEATERLLAETTTNFLACSSSLDLSQRWALLSDAAIRRTLTALMNESGDSAAAVVDRLAAMPWNTPADAYTLSQPRRLVDGRYLGLLQSVSAPGGPTPIIFVEEAGRWRIDDLGRLSEAGPVPPFVGVWQQRGPDGNLLLVAGDGTALAIGRMAWIGTWQALPDHRVKVSFLPTHHGPNDRLGEAMSGDEPASAVGDVEPTVIRFGALVPPAAIEFTVEPEDLASEVRLVLGEVGFTFDRLVPPDMGA